VEKGVGLAGKGVGQRGKAIPLGQGGVRAGKTGVGLKVIFMFQGQRINVS